MQLLLEDRFLAIDDISRVRCPVLVLAGDQDRIVPLTQSRRLYEAATATKELVILEGVGHNDIELLTGDEMLSAIERFVGRLS